MATYTSNTGNNWTLIVDATNVQVDIANNRSKVSWSVKLKDVDRAIDALCTYHLSINGTNVWTSASGGTTITDYTMNNTVTLASGTTGWISHGADGYKSVAISAGIKSNISTASWSIPQLSITNTLTLTTVPRASQPTLNYSTRALGSAITISTNRASDSFTHTLKYAFGTQSGTIGTAKGVTTSQSWTLPSSLASAIPNATSGVGTITCETYNGNTLIGTKSVSFTATVPDNSTYRPTATISSIVQGTTLPSGITVYVQNKSKAKVTSTGTGKYSSTIKTYSVSVAGIGTYTGSVITSDFLRNSGSVRVTLTVTDSRGLKGSTYQDINVIAYSPPQISTFNASRSESTPTNISISYNASISSVSNQNSVVYRIRSLPSGGSWSTNKTVTTGYTSSQSFSITSDPDKSYTIEIYVKDKWTSVTQTVVVGTSFTLMDFNASGKGMAIGKVSESDIFEVGIPTTIFTTEPDLLTLKRSSPFSNVNLVFENDVYTRYISFKETGRPAWSDDPSVNSTGYNFWTEENSNVMTDSGSNPNGHYIKFSDGTMICHRVVFELTYTTNVALRQHWTFPSSFSSGSITVLATFDEIESGRRGKMTIFTRNATTTTVDVLAASDEALFDNSSTQRVKLIAIGRWK